MGALEELVVGRIHFHPRILNRRAIRSLLAIVLVSTLIAQTKADGAFAHAPAQSPGRFEFLFDDTWIDRQTGVEWVLGSSVKIPEPVLKAASPWEADGMAFFSVVYDDDEQKFKMWYRCSCPAAKERPANAPAMPAAKRPGRDQQHFICYAESLNGAQWIRPALRRFTFQGNQENNILQALGSGDTVFYNVLKDPADPDPKRRYKALGYDSTKRSSLRDHPHGGTGVCVAFSSDGLTWNDPPILVMDSSAVTDADCILPDRDPVTGQWVAFLRPRTSPKRRFVGYSTSLDFEHWTHPRMLLTPDSGDDEWTEFYGLAAKPIGGWWVGALWVFHNNPAFSPVTNELVYSRDGLDYRRAMPRQPFVPLGPQGSFDSRVLMPYAVIEQNTDVLIYYRGSNSEHGSSRGTREQRTAAAQKTAIGETPQRSIGLARLKWGHFRGLQAAGDGTVETKWLANYGESGVQAVAEISHDGFIKAEILDVYGNVISGWSKDQSNYHAAGRGILSFFWNQEELVGRAGQVSGQKGKVGHVVKLRFHLHKATLFGFRLGEQASEPP